MVHTYNRFAHACFDMTSCIESTVCNYEVINSISHELVPDQSAHEPRDHLPGSYDGGAVCVQSSHVITRTLLECSI